jgi:8-oxo-dGTP pyrophosphatase MutT (NUDIX family)
MPVIRRPEGLSLLLTVRSADMPTHAGQIALPGGRVQQEDPDLEATALREAEEEVALDRSRVELLGRAPSYVTVTGFHITPVLGLIEDPGPVVANPREVAELFEAPLAFLMNPAHHEQHSREWRGQMRYYFVMPWQGRQIWGATAGMLRALHGALYLQQADG